MHVTPNEFIQREIECRESFNVLQIFLGSPQTFKISSASKEFLEKYSSMYDIYAHAPFLINLVNRSHRVYESSISFLTEVTKLSKYGLKGIVTHLGRLYTKSEYEKGDIPSRIHGDKSIFDALQRLRSFYERSNMKLFLENSVGNDIGSAFDSVPFLVQKVRQAQSLSIRICYDSLHAYAAGELSVDRVKLLKAFKNEIGLIHLNAVEEGVERGNHIDRHSNTAFDSCIKFKVSDYLNLVKEFKNLPFILERGSNIDLGIRDSNTIKDGSK